MTLETGTWTINTNGQVGQLLISSVNPQGNMIGTITLGAGPVDIQGFWDETSQKISFCIIQPIIGNLIFTGFLFPDQFRLTGITGGVVFTLTGYVESFTTAFFNPTARRRTFGWYAQIGVE